MPGGGALKTSGGLMLLEILGQALDLAVTRITLAVLDAQDGVVGYAGSPRNLGQVAHRSGQAIADEVKEISHGNNDRQIRLLCQGTFALTVKANLPIVETPAHNAPPPGAEP